MKSITQSIVNLLSSEIMGTLHKQRSEEYYPQHDTNAMDRKIANAKKRIALLRKMRDDLEDEMSKPLADGF